MDAIDSSHMATLVSLTGQTLNLEPVWPARLGLVLFFMLHVGGGSVPCSASQQTIGIVS